jgi:CheY-like chemotaxis protein
VSGYGMEDDLKKSKECGFEVHLVKPVEIQQLKNAIAYLVRQIALSEKIV